MAQKTIKRTRAENLANDKKFTNAGNFALAVICGLMAGLAITIAIETKTTQQIEIIWFGMLFMSVSLVNTFENRFTGIFNGLLGNLAGMSFFIITALSGKGIDAAIKISILSLETLGLTLFCVAVIAILMKIGALILEPILNRMEKWYNCHKANGNS